MTNISSKSGSSPLKAELGRSIFNELDRNKNGAISKSEFQTALRVAPGTYGAREADEKFRQLDTDQDGGINEQEFLNGLEKMMFWMQGLDALAQSGIIDPLAPFRQPVD